MIIPYSFLDGSWTLPDEVIVGLWNKVEKQNLQNLTFKDREVKNVFDFMNLVKSPANICIVIVDEKSNPVGFSWINGMGKGYGFCHYFFFREYWGELTKFAKEGLKYWFDLALDGKPVFNVLIGVTPPENELGIKFAKKHGWQFIGEIPDVGCISFLHR